jgi:hypothetical protein
VEPGADVHDSSKEAEQSLPRQVAHTCGREEDPKSPFISESIMSWSAGDFYPALRVM